MHLPKKVGFFYSKEIREGRHEGRPWNETVGFRVLLELCSLLLQPRRFEKDISRDRAYPYDHDDLDPSTLSPQLLRLLTESGERWRWLSNSHGESDIVKESLRGATRVEFHFRSAHYSIINVRMHTYDAGRNSLRREYFEFEAFADGGGNSFSSGLYALDAETNKPVLHAS